jgi:beta-galactosidase
VHICGSRYVDRCEQTTKVKVYSNQSRVTLFANGKKVAELAGDRIFEFEIPLSGEVKLEAVAGDQKDTATVRYVSTPNPAYILAKGEGKGANWV